MPHVRSILCVCVLSVFVIAVKFSFSCTGRRRRNNSWEGAGRTHTSTAERNHTQSHIHNNYPLRVCTFVSHITHTHTASHFALLSHTYSHICHFSHSSFCPHRHADIYASIFLNFYHTHLLTYSTSHFLRSASDMYEHNHSLSDAEGVPGVVDFALSAMCVCVISGVSQTNCQLSWISEIWTLTCVSHAFSSPRINR